MEANVLSAGINKNSIFKKVVTHWVLSVLLMLFIISVAVTFTLHFKPLYYHDIKALDIEGTSGYSYDVIKRNYDAMVDYNSLFGPDKLEFPDLAMSEGGRIHFEEVKVLFNKFEVCAIITGIISLILIIFMKRKHEYRYLKYTSIITVAVPAVLGLLIGLNWEKAFVTFHHMFFNNDYWIFDAETDPVITILPDTFFFHCAFLIIGLVIAGSVICLILYLICKKRAKARTNI